MRRAAIASQSRFMFFFYFFFFFCCLRGISLQINSVFTPASPPPLPLSPFFFLPSPGCFISIFFCFVPPPPPPFFFFFFFFFALQSLQIFSDLHNKSIYQNNTMITGCSGIITMKYWLLFQTQSLAECDDIRKVSLSFWNFVYCSERDAIEVPWTTHKHPSNCVFFFYLCSTVGTKRFCTVNTTFLLTVCV